MADQDCDYCNFTSSCMYAYDEANCRVQQIEEAKKIVTDEFKSFISKLDLINEELCCDTLSHMLEHAHTLWIDSEQEL